MLLTLLLLAGSMLCADPTLTSPGLREKTEAIATAQAPENKSDAPLRLRGDTLDFPFYLGVDLYEGRWRHHANIEKSPDSWWLDKGHWAWRLRRCTELHINALLLCHPHPFPALIDLPDMPEAAYFEAEHLRRLQEHFGWVLDEAEKAGVKIYFLTWNIWVSPGFARAHNLPQEGADGALVRAYTRACYRRLFETYPKLAGIMTMAGEAPPGCVDFVRDAIVGALNTLEKRPELLFWMWCAYPEDAKAILDAYQGPKSLVHYLQYEQLFRPQADPRIKRASQAVGGAPVVTLGGLGTATGWLYWSDPYYIRDIMADLARQNVAGCFFMGLDSFHWVCEKWLGWQALARYWWEPLAGREDEYWERRIEEHFGPVPRPPSPQGKNGDLASQPSPSGLASGAGLGEAGTPPSPGLSPDGAGPKSSRLGRDFLQASIAASSIPTRLLALLHRQTDHHMPQFGLPLCHYLGLPTLSTYVFENHERIDEQGRLVPRLGLTWPNPDWGEKVIGIADFVRGETEGTTPLQIADELERAAETTLACLERLRAWEAQVSVGPEKWRRCLDQMEMNAHLGIHTAQKVRAAVAWERWRTRQGDRWDVVYPLLQSVRAMERMAQVADRLYPGIDIHTYRNAISRPWPWTHLQIWNLDTWRKHSFSDSAAMFRRELDWVVEELQRNYPQPLLPFEDDLQPMPANARLLVRWDFEGEPPRGIRLNSFPPDAQAVLGDGEGPPPLAGRRLVAEQKTANFYFPLTTDPATLPLEIGKRYRVVLDYWIVRDAEPLGDWLSAGARTTDGGWQRDVGARYMGGPGGTRGRITLTFTPQTWKDYYVYVSLHGQATVELDNLEVWVGE